MKLNDYKNWFTYSDDEFIVQNEIDRSQVEENVRYEKITQVTRVHGPNEEFLFFKDGTLRIIYISSEILCEGLWREFKKSFDTSAPEKMVRSRAGKPSNQLIFAKLGFTVSLKGDNVDFIEIYPPCSLEDYLDNVYREPGLFIR